MNDTCMMSLTRSELSERKNYDAIKRSLEELLSAVKENQDVLVSICTSEGICLFIERKGLLYNIKLGVDHNQEYISFALSELRYEAVEELLHSYCTYSKSELLQLIKRKNTGP